jgi:hypothetical protein
MATNKETLARGHSLEPTSPSAVLSSDSLSIGLYPGIYSKVTINSESISASPAYQPAYRTWFATILYNSFDANHSNSNYIHFSVTSQEFIIICRADVIPKDLPMNRMDELNCIQIQPPSAKNTQWNPLSIQAFIANLALQNSCTINLNFHHNSTQFYLISRPQLATLLNPLKEQGHRVTMIQTNKAKPSLIHSNTEPVRRYDATNNYSNANFSLSFPSSPQNNYAPLDVEAVEDSSRYKPLESTNFSESSNSAGSSTKKDSGYALFNNSDFKQENGEEKKYRPIHSNDLEDSTSRNITSTNNNNNNSIIADKNNGSNARDNHSHDSSHKAYEPLDVESFDDNAPSAANAAISHDNSLSGSSSNSSSKRPIDVDLESKPFFKGTLDKNQISKILKSAGPGNSLFRNTNSGKPDPNIFVISYLEPSGQILHFKVLREANSGWKLIDNNNNASIWHRSFEGLTKALAGPNTKLISK